MNIAGIDFSKNSPGIVFLILDNDLNISSCDWLGFTTVKKISSDKIIYYKNEWFFNDIDKSLFLREKIELLYNKYNPEYTGFEGYAFAARGRVFDIAETTAITKLMVYLRSSKIRIYDPNSVKKYFCLYGNADKVRMEEEFKKIKDIKPDISNLPTNKSPTEDIIDAYAVSTLLLMELKIRKGLINLKELDEKRIEVFNRTTKSFPENILVRPFIYKEGDNEQK